MKLLNALKYVFTFQWLRKNQIKKQDEVSTPTETSPEQDPEVSVPVDTSSGPVSTYNPKPNRDPSKPVLIVDVYHHDNIVDWKKIADFADGIILKVSEGENHLDTKFVTWRKEAKAAGLLVGFYHFYRTNKDPIKQANLFCNAIGELQQGEFLVACDFETEDDPKDGFDILETEQFNAVVEQKLKVIPWYYGGWIFKQSGEKFKVPARFERNPLWLSHYTTKDRPVVPSPWKMEKLWQYTETANVPGINNPKGTDLNRFNGTYQELLDLCYVK